LNSIGYKMKKEEAEIILLSQLTNCLDEATSKLEKFYNEKNYEFFYKTKKIILVLERKIAEEIK